MKILTVEQMRHAELECEKLGISTATLMENAGRAVAEEVRHIRGQVKEENILVLAGPGNNGGDGLVAARYLHDGETNVVLYLLGQRSAEDSNLKLVRQHGITCLDSAQDENLARLESMLSAATVVIDAVFGTGKSRPLTGTFAGALGKVRQARQRRPSLRIIALDLPSGLDADSGAVDPACLHADHTVTLGFPKHGLFRFPGAERVGKLSIVDIGIPPSLVERVADEMLTDDWARSVLPRRPPDANKGTFGKVLVVAGSVNYIGAAYLACSGAMRVGAGLVTLATASSLQPVLASKLTEVTYLPLPESEPGIISSDAPRVVQREVENYTVLLAGCGLGQSLPATRFIRAVLLRLRPALPLVLDADALNILARVPGWWRRLHDSAILTPHPGEMSRLTGLTVDEIQSDRVGVTRRMATEWKKVVVLKGAFTVIASPDGRCGVNPAANAGLASAGTGDVLAGAIAGLVAQGVPLFDAAALGVFLHTRAGERVRDRLGDTGMVASDLIPELPLALRRLKEEGNE